MTRCRELRTTCFLSTENLTLVKLQRARMANRGGSEHQSPSRSPVRLLGSVLLLGTLLAWCGTRDQRRLFGESLSEPVADGSVVHTKVTQEERATLDRGSQTSL